MLSVAEAHARLMALFVPLASEPVPLAEAAGRVLAVDAIAARAQPPFAAASMDGFALRGEDLRGAAPLMVIGTARAGERFAGRVEAGQAVRIFTGAPVPDGADTVLIQEDAEVAGNQLLPRPGRDSSRYVRPAGTDFDKGFRLRAPRRLGASDIALLAAMNVPRPICTRRPIIALIPTGDELIWPGETPGPDQIVSSNNFGLKALLEAEGAEARLLPVARDNQGSLDAVFDLAAGADAIVTLGGASVGEHDLVQAAGMRRGLALDFYKIAMRPGKPLMAGRLGATPFVGLPGNPVSAMVCGHLFLRSAVRTMLGLDPAPPVPVRGRLVTALGPNGPRAHYMRGCVTPGPEGWLCEVLDRQDSALLSVLAAANALIVRSPDDPARAAGDTIGFLHL